VTSPQGFGFYAPGTAPAATPRPTRPTVLTRSAKLVGGALVAVIGRPGQGQSWNLRRITVNGPTATVARVYVGDPADLSSFVDGTNSGAGDVSEYVVPLLVLDGAELTIAWTRSTPALTAADVATARVELDELG